MFERLRQLFLGRETAPSLSPAARAELEFSGLGSPTLPVSAMLSDAMVSSALNVKKLGVLAAP